MQRIDRIGTGNESGNALLIAVVATVVLAGMAGAMMVVTGAFQDESVASIEDTRSLYVAEAGLAQGIARVRADDLTNFGDAANAIAFGGGTYWGTVANNGDDTVTVSSYATVGGRAHGLETTMVKDVEDIYLSALFAGNSSRDRNYEMNLGGSGTQADQVNGHIYSGGDVTITGDASVNGDIVASGSINGGLGEQGSKSPPDIAAMDYENNHDYDVASLFSGASYGYGANAVGGKAWQLPESSPGHIFRKNPTDRKSAWQNTAKEDFFLEDPYEAVNKSSTIDASAGAHITLSGMDGNPGPNGNQKVYYIDGNLWIHNTPMYSFTLYNSGPEAVQLTFIVKGNIYFSDNVFYNSPDDAVAFIAINDENEADSGNIYFGDPIGGTLEEMNAFMYAENDFLDQHMDAAGSKRVTVNGNMTAGNHVDIQRDFNGSHSKLTVDFDDRIATGAVTLPGLPGSDGDGDSWTVGAWREIALP